MRGFTLLSALGSVALSGWVMVQASIASRTSSSQPSAPAISPAASPAAGTLTPEQLAALEFNQPATARRPASSTPLRPAAAPKRVVAAAAPPAATTGTS